MSAAVIWPGLGHLIAGRIFAALFWAIMWCAVLAGFAVTYFLPHFIWAIGHLLLLAALVRVIQVVDAARVARKSRRIIFATPALRYTAGIFLSPSSATASPRTSSATFRIITSKSVTARPIACAQPSP